jgi:hypothetical protein
MTNERFVSNYLKPFMIAYDNSIVDLRYIDRAARYQLINITFDNGCGISVDVTGKSQRQMADEVFGRLNKR